MGQAVTSGNGVLMARKGMYVFIYIYIYVCVIYLYYIISYDHYTMSLINFSRLLRMFYYDYHVYIYICTLIDIYIYI